MATQVQIRGAAQATQEARTLAARELDINTTDYRIVSHNGVTAGGIPHINYLDQINNEYSYAGGSGTDTITASLAIAPTAYQAGFTVLVKIANNNTGAATLNIDSVGAVAIKKPSGGSLVDVEADDLVQNAVYKFTHNGTYFIVESVGGSGSSAPQTQTAAVSSTLDFDSVFESGNNYIIRFANLRPSSSGIMVGVRFTDDDGSTFESTNYSQRGSIDNGSTLARLTGSSNYAYVTQNGFHSGNAGMSGFIYIGNPADSIATTFNFNIYYDNTSGSGATYSETGSGKHNSATALTGFQILPSSGTLKDGTVTLETLPHA